MIVNEPLTQEHQIVMQLLKALRVEGDETKSSLSTPSYPTQGKDIEDMAVLVSLPSLGKSNPQEPRIRYVPKTYVFRDHKTKNPIKYVTLRTHNKEDQDTTLQGKQGHLNLSNVKVETYLNHTRDPVTKKTKTTTQPIKERPPGNTPEERNRKPGEQTTGDHQLSQHGLGDSPVLSHLFLLPVSSHHHHHHYHQPHHLSRPAIKEGQGSVWNNKQDNNSQARTSYIKALMSDEGFSSSQERRKRSIIRKRGIMEEGEEIEGDDGGVKDLVATSKFLYSFLTDPGVLITAFIHYVSKDLYIFFYFS